MKHEMLDRQKYFHLLSLNTVINKHFFLQLIACGILKTLMNCFMCYGFVRFSGLGAARLVCVPPVPGLVSTGDPSLGRSGVVFSLSSLPSPGTSRPSRGNSGESRERHRMRYNETNRNNTATTMQRR